MTPTRPTLPSMSAALAGVPAGVQPYGPWTGRRQLFLRFADEAETATIYTAAAIKGEIARLAARSRYHSIAITGRDPLAEVEFLVTAFRDAPTLPVMLDHDGQRGEALESLLPALRLMQICVNGGESDGMMERICDSIGRSAKHEVSHAVAIVPADPASDARLHRIVERVHAASAATRIVLHPSTESMSGPDRRWLAWLEQAAAVHDDVRILPVVPPVRGPAAMQQP